MKKLIDAPYINQCPDYPTGCETISTIMYLRYLGIEVDIDEFIEKYLPKKDLILKGGKWIGPDPNEYFVGSPYDQNSFGCYPLVMVKALTAFFEAEGLPFYAADVTNVDTDTLLELYINNDIPVLYWTCIDMNPVKVGPSWELYDSGEEFTWMSNEHCLLLTGYDDDNLITNDPWNGNGVIAYKKEEIIKHHYEQHAGGVVILKK